MVRDQTNRAQLWKRTMNLLNGVNFFLPVPPVDLAEQKKGKNS